MLGEDAKPPEGAVCEAMVHCRGGSDFYGQQGRCRTLATHYFNGRACCWNHWKAAQNVDRKSPVEFVESEGEA